MSPKKRSHKNQDLAGTNIQITTSQKGTIYYSYENKRAYNHDTHQVESVKIPLGNNNPKSEKYITREKLKRIAAVLNEQYAMPHDRALLERIKKVKRRNIPTVSHVLTEFREIYLPTRKNKRSTLSNKEFKLRKYENEYGHLEFSKNTITVGFINKHILAGLSDSAYIKHRELWIQICQFAGSQEYLPPGVNPAEATLRRIEPKRQRQRLTLDAYKLIYKESPEWLQIAMDFMLVSLQPREIVVLAKHTYDKNNPINGFEEFSTPVKTKTGLVYGRLRVLRGKSDDYLDIGVYKSLYDVIQRSKRTTIASPFIVHKLGKRHKKKEHHTQVLPDYLTGAFKDVVSICHEKYGLYAGIDRNKWATPHEIRSLGGELYEDAGFSEQYIMDLRGHEDKRMHERYQKDRRIVWDEVEAGLNLDEVMK